MKIGILTLPLHTNYGGILQAYALQTILERMGHEVVVFKWKRYVFKGFPLYKALLIYSKRILIGNELRKEYRLEREKGIVYRRIDESIDRLIHYSSQTIDSSQTLINYCDSVGFDALVVGSDQVWRKSYDRKSFFNYFFRRGSFPDLNTYYLEGIYIIKNVYGWNVDIKNALDPTLLLEAKDYVNLSNFAASRPSNPYLFYYVLDESREKTEILKCISEELSIEIKTISPNSGNRNPEKRVLPSVEEWLAMFAKADFVLTDSYHGMLFSIIFHKPFYVIGNKKRGMARFDSLLETLKICDRLIYKNKINLSRLKQIQWQHLNTLINDCRQDSIKILFNFVNNERT